MAVPHQRPNTTSPSVLRQRAVRPVRTCAKTEETEQPERDADGLYYGACDPSNRHMQCVGTHRYPPSGHRVYRDLSCPRDPGGPSIFFPAAGHGHCCQVDPRRFCWCVKPSATETQGSTPTSGTTRSSSRASSYFPACSRHFSAWATLGLPFCFLGSTADRSRSASRRSCWATRATSEEASVRAEDSWRRWDAFFGGALTGRAGQFRCPVDNPPTGRVCTDSDAR